MPCDYSSANPIRNETSESVTDLPTISHNGTNRTHETSLALMESKEGGIMSQYHDDSIIPVCTEMVRKDKIEEYRSDGRHRYETTKQHN
eukprot:9065714-Ditylum_brightwellii.AAC.1